MIFVDLSEGGNFKNIIIIQHYKDSDLNALIEWCNENVSSQIMRFTPEIVGYKKNNYLSKIDPDGTGLSVTKEYRVRSESFLQINFTKEDDYLKFRLRWEDSNNFTGADVIMKE